MKKTSLLALALFALCSMQLSFADAPKTVEVEEEEVVADVQDSSEEATANLSDPTVAEDATS